MQQRDTVLDSFDNLQEYFFSDRIFGHHGKDADNIIYINWLNMVRAGLCGLEFYTPETGTWRQVSSAFQQKTPQQRDFARV